MKIIWTLEEHTLPKSLAWNLGRYYQTVSKAFCKGQIEYKQQFQAELKERLTPTQYLVTQEHQTEKYKKLVKEIVNEI